MIVPLLLFAGAARAQLAVFDVASLNQLVQQAQMLTEQLVAARAQLSTLQVQYQAMTGSRGMQSLLAGSVRNYLPSQWPEIAAIEQGDARGSEPLARNFHDNLQGNAFLSAQQLAQLPASASVQISAARKSVALLQAVSEIALANSSARFAAIQRLIDAIPDASDQKGILDLQARIGAEQSMLQNEQTKLQVLYQAAAGQAWAVHQREREQVIAGHGRFVSRFEPAPRQWLQ